MPLELQIKDAPRQDLETFKEYVYRIRIEVRPDITVEEALNRRAIVYPKAIPFLEFDLPASVVAPGCDENWQKAAYVLHLKRQPYEAARYLVEQGIKFGVLARENVPEWDRPLLE